MKALLFATVALVAVPLAATAQTPRRQQPIEIRGTVPTPQVVTVRPREVPTYDRRVLVPTFYDHDFWQSILPSYLVVRQRMITGGVPGDSLIARRDTALAPARTPTQPPPPVTGSPPPPAPPTPPPAAAPSGGMPPSSIPRSATPPPGR